MLENLRQSIGLTWSRLYFRKSKENVISFTGAFSTAKTLLLIMPLDPHQTLPTTMVIEMIKQRIDQRRITVVAADHPVETMRLLPRSRFIHILRSEINMFFLPCQRLIAEIKKKKYDVAIDLSLDLVLPSAYIVKASDARVRIGFARRRASRFYNFQIQPDPNLSSKQIYHRFAQCLEMF